MPVDPPTREAEEGGSTEPREAEGVVSRDCTTALSLGDRVRLSPKEDEREEEERKQGEGRGREGRHREKMAIYEPRREAWNISVPHGPQKEPT